MADERKAYMRDVYSRYWLTARETKYGFLPYDKNLCKFVCRAVPKGSTMLEVAMGTGYPFADFFQRIGYHVSGIDISERLIEKSRMVNPNIVAKVCEAENLLFPDNQFDCTYCFHSTWYFSDLFKAIDEMIRVTKPNGLVVFDIQNLRNKRIAERFERSRRKKKTLIFKLYYWARFRVWIHHDVVYETPIEPRRVYEHLAFPFSVLTVDPADELHIGMPPSDFPEYQRLVIVVSVGGNKYARNNSDKTIF